MISLTTKILLFLSASMAHAALEVNPNFPNGSPKSQFQICLEKNVNDGLQIGDAFGKCKSLLPDNISTKSPGQKRGKMAQVDVKFPNGLAKSAYQICLENAVKNGLHISQAFAKCSSVLPDLVGAANKQPSEEWIKMNCGGMTRVQCTKRYNEGPERPAQTASETRSQSPSESSSAK